MADRLHVATRKGLFTVDRSGAGWRVTRSAFLGDPVSIVVDAGGGRLYAALGLGHFGVKLHRSADGGETWEECAAPAYPPKPEGLEDLDGNGKPVEWRGGVEWGAGARGGGAPDAGGGGAPPP